MKKTGFAIRPCIAQLKRLTLMLIFIFGLAFPVNSQFSLEAERITDTVNQQQGLTPWSGTSKQVEMGLSIIIGTLGECKTYDLDLVIKCKELEDTLNDDFSTMELDFRMIEDCTLHDDLDLVIECKKLNNVTYKYLEPLVKRHYKPFSILFIENIVRRTSVIIDG